MTSPDRAALDRLTARIREQVAALPPPRPEDVEHLARVLMLIRLDAARAARAPR